MAFSKSFGSVIVFSFLRRSGLGGQSFKSVSLQVFSHAAARGEHLTGFQEHQREELIDPRVHLGNS